MSTHEATGEISISTPWGLLGSNGYYPLLRLEGRLLRLYVPTDKSGLEPLISVADTWIERDSSKQSWLVRPGADERDFNTLLSLVIEQARELLPKFENREREWASQLLWLIVFWRTGVPKEGSGPSAHTTGLWGELMTLRQLETSGLVENASTLWRSPTSKWDLCGDPGRLYPAEVKTTTGNTHTHVLRHEQLREGSDVGLRIISIRCSVTDNSSSQTLEEMLKERQQLAIGVGASACMLRCDLELRRLTDAARKIRYLQEGVTQSLKASALPPFPEPPAEYRNIRYEVSIYGSLGIESLRIDPQ